MTDPEHLHSRTGAGTGTVPGPSGILGRVPDPAGAPTPFPAAAALAGAVAAGDLDLPLPGSGATAERWARLAAVGRRDLPVARLAEGHTDAVAILAEHGRGAAPGVTYGVWASRAGGGARLGSGPGGPRLGGTVRFCSGTHLLDRALVVAGAGDDATRIVDVDLRDPRVERRTGAWRAAGMAAADTDDVVLHDVPVPPEAFVGGPDAYTGRPGFRHGGAGVAAVWLGGAAGIVDEIAAGLRGTGGDPHRLAGLGTLHAAVAAADALLGATAAAIDADPADPHRIAVAAARAAVERACRTVLDAGPETAGVTVLAGSDRLAARLADLQVYLRQHHGARDLADLGRAVLGEED
ncbi:MULTISPECIES: acyl-CoA dehydrogenase [unclassified Pseudonocardia]|uniref:acyl-CoA dehydrogenase n=1 Tax=unclassified Pseudonocardia TaxID=2619320 RepID=UPI000AF3DC77|nr:MULTISPECIES: acyl-CoA dehydrogenase [unclassified Pseudonocardia]